MSPIPHRLWASPAVSSEGNVRATEPIGFGGQQGNQYAYVDGDPVNRRDVSGLSPEDGCGLEAIGAGLTCFVVTPLSISGGPCTAIAAGTACGFAAAQ